MSSHFDVVTAALLKSYCRLEKMRLDRFDRKLQTEHGVSGYKGSKGVREEAGGNSGMPPGGRAGVDAEGW